MNEEESSFLTDDEIDETSQEDSVSDTSGSRSHLSTKS